jgi:hypothetical protein
VGVLSICNAIMNDSLNRDQAYLLFFPLHLFSYARMLWLYIVLRHARTTGIYFMQLARDTPTFKFAYEHIAALTTLTTLIIWILDQSGDF